jgi:hypothetical protein
MLQLSLTSSIPIDAHSSSSLLLITTMILDVQHHAGLPFKRLSSTSKTLTEEGVWPHKCACSGLNSMQL